MELLAIHQYLFGGRKAIYHKARELQQDVSHDFIIFHYHYITPNGARAFPVIIAIKIKGKPSII